MGWDDWNGDGVNADAKPPNVEKKHLGYHYKYADKKKTPIAKTNGNW